MLYLEEFEAHHARYMGILTSCVNLHADPMACLQLPNTLVACNEHLTHLLGVEKLTDIKPIHEWFSPKDADPTAVLFQPGSYAGTITAGGHVYQVAVLSEVIMLDRTPIIGVVFRDVTLIERARAAQSYFKLFKERFLSNISREFRTPMNAIVGFTDLLRNSTLNPMQQEYVQLTQKSATSMMRNIENLLELTQVESGSVQTVIAPFSPLDVFEPFLLQFEEVAHAKGLEFLFLLDPRLPKTIEGDSDKILTIMRNLIQNGVKFTPQGGRVFIEILIMNEDETHVEIEYAITDTGVGIEKEKMARLLRPFASALDQQEGLGVGLSLSHKYIQMMSSQLLLASEVGHGSRFSFRLRHTIDEAHILEPIEGASVVIYTSEEQFSPQGTLLVKYFERYHLKVQKIHSLLAKELAESSILFLDIPYLSAPQMRSIVATYPKLHLIPLVSKEPDEAILASVDLCLIPPITPSGLSKILGQFWSDLKREPLSHHHEILTPTESKEVKRLLVAEDNLINLKLLQTLLTHEGFDVTPVDNGKKAVDVYLKERFDLVLMDIDMPIMDGFMANRLIKEIDKRDGRGFVPVIALTAHALIGDRERIVAAGLDGYLTKPIDKPFLIQTIHNHLRIAQQKQLNQSRNV